MPYDDSFGVTPQDAARGFHSMRQTRTPPSTLRVVYFRFD